MGAALDKICETSPDGEGDFVDGTCLRTGLSLRHYSWRSVSHSRIPGGFDGSEKEIEQQRVWRCASKSVKSAMHREKKGTLRSGKGGKGGKVTSRKQAIAIGLSEARKKGAKVPEKKVS